MEKRWDLVKSQQWYAQLPWLVGCNFTPSTAINQLEFWQADSFDEETIRRELGWAKNIGMNVLRVYLHDLLWQADADGFFARMNRYLDIAAGYGIRTLFCIFDDCWNPSPRVGKQPEPVPGVHNSGWMQSPGIAIVNSPTEWGRLEKYLKAVLARFSGDERVLGWDLYNEPGNSQQGDKSFPLLKQVFEWAWEVRPSQPLTCGVWNFTFAEMNRFQIEAADVVSFHHYGPLDALEELLVSLQVQAQGRPLICTEYMSRGIDSRFETHLPVFKRERVGAINWGLVSGKTQTKYPWGSQPGAPEPELWFHEIFHPDGTPYRQAEVDVIRRLTAQAAEPER